MFLGSRNYEPGSHERNRDVRFKLTLSTKRQELTRFHRKKCGNEGAEKKRKLKRVEEIKGGKGKENRENEGGEEREEGGK